jgi:hypothetical protein
MKYLLSIHVFTVISFIINNTFLQKRGKKSLFQESKIQTINHHLRKIDLWSALIIFIQIVDFEHIQIHIW